MEESKPIEKDECLRCGYRWWRKTPKKPVSCPDCKSPYWNKLRRKDIKKDGK